MGNERVRKDYLSEDEDLSQLQYFGERVVTTVRFSTDPRDIGWVRENVPCQAACPADTNIPGYIRTIVEGRYGRSYELNRIANILPGVLGRICSRPCEPVCRHGWPGNGEPVSICHLKRSAASLKTESHRISEDLYTPTGRRIAIVGGGPAGIAAAHDLSILGHNVTIYEREARAGGMLRYGIPEFRLPREVLDIEVQNATRMGVTLQTGVTVGCNEGDIPLSELLDRFDAVLLATGCMAAMPLPLRDQLDGRDLVQELPNAEYGLNFLLDLHRGEKKTVGQRVAVVGAGFTSLDCARVARRLGAERVTIHIRTSENYIPVMDEEILEAKREGIPIRGLRTPVAVQVDGNGLGTGICFVQNRLGGWRAGGRREAIPIPDSEFVEPFDTLLVAIGQRSINDYLDLPVELDRWGSVRVGEDGMTSVKGLFATGDFVNGSSTVIEAIGHGRETAGKLDSWLMQRVRQRKVVRIESVDKPVRERQFDFIGRQSMPTATVADRFEGLTTEVEQGLDTDHSLAEAKRCYLCYLKYEIDVDNCIYCRACIEAAPRDCIKLVKGVEINDDGTYGELRETNVWRDTAAIWIDNDECIRCGACYKVCPTRCISISKNEIITQSA